MRDERGTDQPDGDFGHHDMPHPRDLLAAIGTLTILPLPRPAPDSDAFARATLFFPVVGLALGGFLAVLNGAGANRLPAWLGAVLLVAVWEALTPRNGGSVALRLIAAVVKVIGLAVVPAARPAALLFAPLLARWCVVVLATGARDADVPGRKFNAAITFREFALTSVFTLAVVFSVAEAFGIFIVLCVGALALGLRLYVHRYASGVSWRLLVAATGGIEALVVALCAAL